MRRNAPVAPREDHTSGAHYRDRIVAFLRTLRLSVSERRLLLKDRRHLSRHLRVELNEALPLLGHIPFREDCLHRAFDSARIAIDAIVRIDIQHLITLVKALARANHHAVGVFAAKAWSGHDVSHVVPFCG